MTDFTTLRRKNLERIDTHSFGHTHDEWLPTDWACAMAGETGEACNLIKKLRRGEDIDPTDIGRELADVIIYADLLALRLGLDLGEMVRMKFNEVSDRYGVDIKI